MTDAPTITPDPDRDALRDRIADLDLDAISARAADAQQYGIEDDGFEQLVREDVPALVAEVRCLRADQAADTGGFELRGDTEIRAAALRQEADRIDATRAQFPIAVQNGITWATAELRRHAAETATTETPEWARPETEEEKLAKARRIAKALSAPPVAPPEWETTTEWPGRHKRPGDRRVHATARFVVNDIQRFWTACGEHVGRGGAPMGHMPVDCRGCKRATAAGARQGGATQ